MSLIRVAVLTSLWVSAALPAYAAETVPTDIQMPGTQPGEIGNLEAPTKCDNCHGGYDAAVEPAHNWPGSMMAHAGRDPIFWATVAVAEQDFDGVGDLCIRCHSTEGWIEGRSTPTDGSALTRRDASGVACDFCHKATNPNDSEWLGVQNPPFVANDGGPPATGYYGSGMASLCDRGQARVTPLFFVPPENVFIAIIQVQARQAMVRVKRQNPPDIGAGR